VVDLTLWLDANAHTDSNAGSNVNKHDRIEHADHDLMHDDFS
jgi:hypothetical protein